MHILSSPLSTVLLSHPAKYYIFVFIPTRLSFLEPVISFWFPSSTRASVPSFLAISPFPYRSLLLPSLPLTVFHPITAVFTCTLQVSQFSLPVCLTFLSPPLFPIDHLSRRSAPNHPTTVSLTMSSCFPSHSFSYLFSFLFARHAFPFLPPPKLFHGLFVEFFSCARALHFTPTPVTSPI